MKTWNSLSKGGPAAAVMLAGVLVLATGCVGDRVTYVQRPYPVTVQAPEPPPPPPVIELPPAPPPAPVATMRSVAELDQMLAPIALYPDPLLAQLLPAATLPAQVVLADRYLREGGDMNQVDAQPWDNSLKALARYPSTLRMLDDNLAWTTDLGQAFLNQPADVMDSVQRLRAQARALGNLISTPQQTVVVDDGLIEIVPAAPQVIYVPVYQPEVVYVQRPPAFGRLYVSFGAGLVVGTWLNHDCDWHAHEVIVWHQDHPRPTDWWYHPATRHEAPKVVNHVIVVNNTTVVNQNFTVWRPRTAGAVADRGDRGWGQQDARVPVPARNEAAKPAWADVRQPPVVAATPRPVPGKEDRTAPPVKETRPRQPEVQRPPARAPEPLPNAPLEAAKPTPLATSREVVVTSPAKETPPARALETRVTPPREAAKPTPVVPTREVRLAPQATPPPAVTAPARAPVGALAGIESSRVTREASARGQQSREAMAKPVAPVRPAPAPMPSPKASAVETKQPQKSR